MLSRMLKMVEQGDLEHRRARRRLLGAAFLAAVAVAVLPWALDDAPPQVLVDQIVIEMQTPTQVLPKPLEGTEEAESALNQKYYEVWLGSYRDVVAAQRLVTQAEALGVQLTAQRVDVPNVGPVVRLRAGKYAHYEQARKILSSAETLGLEGRIVYR